MPERTNALPLGTWIQIGGTRWEVTAVLSLSGERHYLLMDRDHPAHTARFPADVVEVQP